MKSLILLSLFFIVSKLTGVYLVEINDKPVCIVVNQNSKILIGKIYFSLDEAYSFIVDNSIDHVLYETEKSAIFFSNDGFYYQDGEENQLNFKKISSKTDYSLLKIFKDQAIHPIVGEWVMVAYKVNGKSTYDESIKNKYVFKYLENGELFFDLRFWRKTFNELKMPIDLSSLPDISWQIHGDNLLEKFYMPSTQRNMEIDSKVIIRNDSLYKFNDDHLRIYVRVSEK